MSKVRDNSAPKIILGACWGARAIACHSLPSLYLLLEKNIPLIIGDTWREVAFLAVNMFTPLASENASQQQMF